MTPPKLSRRDLLAMLPALPAARLLAQQPPPPSPVPPGSTFSTDVNVVNIFATVRDKDGHIVTNLAKEDFTLQEDGRPQTIRYFSRETDLPLTLGLLVDTSFSQRTVIGAERTASSSFLQNLLRVDKDKAFIIHFDKDVELLQDLTSSRVKLDKAVSELEVGSEPARDNNGSSGGSSGGSGGGYPGGGGGYPGGGRFPGGEDGAEEDGTGGGGASHHGGGTKLYDAIMLASDELMKKQTGRKSVVVLSDGVDRGSKTSIGEAIEHAQRADTLVYSILFAGHEGFGGFGGGGMGRRGGGRDQEDRPDGKKVLERVAKETGGGFFEVSKKHTVDQIYAQIQEELRSQYSLGYTSDQQVADAGYRKIILATARKGLIVQTREGYYPAHS